MIRDNFGTYLVGKLPLAAALIWVFALRAAQAQTFDFAGYSWAQLGTPDVATSIAAGTVEGAVFTAQPSSATASVAGFPNDLTGFDPALSPGRLLGLAGTGTRAVNLPSGNNGGLARSGFQLSWSGGRRMRNQTGTDFVIYESASSSNAPEAFMVQVHRFSPSEWSRWYYQPADAHQLYVGEPTEGACVTAFDLTSFGLGPSDEIDAVRIANITDEDRMDPPGTEISPGIFVGTGFVRTDDLGSTSQVVPDPGPLAGFQLYGASTLDPDILYFGSISIPNICGDGEVLGGEACDDGNTDDLDGCSSSCQLEVPQEQPQRNCLKILNNAGARVAATQGKSSLACLNGAGRGEVADAQACLTADVSGRIAKARNKTVKAFTRGCPTVPTFGATDTTVVNDAAQEEEVALIADIFGSDLQSVAISAASDSHGARCQAATLKASEQLAAVERRLFLICKRLGLDSGAIVSPAGLQACFDDVAADARGKIAAAQKKLAAAIADKCAGATLATAFPGNCSAAPDLTACLRTQVNCRVCRTFNRMDVLTRDCDDFDDATNNDSCQSF